MRPCFPPSPQVGLVLLSLPRSSQSVAFGVLLPPLSFVVFSPHRVPILWVLPSTFQSSAFSLLLSLRLGSSSGPRCTSAFSPVVICGRRVAWIAPRFASGFAALASSS